MNFRKFIHIYYIEISVFLIAISSGIFLMFSTFYVSQNKLYIASKAWSDFASHIPLIRSFSLGANFPPQYPLFPGEPIKYHFLFYSLVGILEKIGIRIDLGLNILSAFGFTALVIIVYLLAKEVFKSKAVGFLSIVFLLLNSSFSFVYFLKNHPLSSQILNQIFSNKDFQSFAPYGSGIVSAFWNLNIYTNQRHLGLSFALSLGIIYLLVRTINKRFKLNLKVSILLGIILGLSFFLHVAVFLMTSAVILSFAILFPQIRKNLIILLLASSLLAFPQYLYLNSSPGYQMHVLIGYLISESLNLNKVLEFWIYNLGASIILIPLGFLLATKNQRKILLSFFALFVVGNLIQFSPEIAANHKFFNYFLLIGNMFSAFSLIKLWNKKNIFLKAFVAALLFLMVFGGIIDFFPILNDSKIVIADYKIDKRSEWILKNTPPNSIFLNTTFLYDPASLAGRKIFLGWPYFAWSQGYNTDKRAKIMGQMLGAENKQTACKLLRENEIDYVEIQIQNPPDPNIPPISSIYTDQFISAYKNITNSYTIYSVNSNCRT